MAQVIIELKNDLAELSRLAEAIEEFGDAHALSPRVLTEMNIALEGIITNIISYGFDDAREHRIRVELRLNGSQLTTRIEDDGRPFDPLQVVEPDVDVPLEERKIGGLGILLAKKFMDGMEYSRMGERNVLIMRRAAQPQPL